MPRAEIRKVLVANRGEIALRVIRACRMLGIGTVAIYSDADRTAPHVLAADHAIASDPRRRRTPIRASRRLWTRRAGPARTRSTRLWVSCGEFRLCGRLRGRGDSLHRPSRPYARTLCDKAETRRAARAAGVPILPGTESLDDVAAAGEAQRLGYPVLIKAAAGGGGKGIHRVPKAEDLAGALRLARGEARASFGDDRVYLERWVDDPRHVEVQIAADERGEIVHLGERECSIQRRHQKIIEEAPSPALTAPLREAMGRAAIAAARAVDYRNVGTVEFLVDGDAFYFLEINARLQVEHPVTELVTGVDVVAWQLAIAAGAPLPLAQDQIALRGHAIECRISAEDPSAEFVPWAGRVDAVVLLGGPGIRIDGALVPGLEVTGSTIRCWRRLSRGRRRAWTRSPGCRRRCLR